MRWCFFVACCAACSATEAPVGNLLIEYQARDRADVRDADWSSGSAIVVAEAPSFPQPLSVRVRVVDDANADYGVAQVSLSMYGTTQLQAGDTTSGCYYRLPDVAASYCTYDFDVVGLGSSMILVTANAPHDAPVRDCFFYAIVDSTTDVDVLRASLDARVDTCRRE